MNPAVDFSYVRVNNMKDAIVLLHKHGAEAKIFAGGTELLVNIKQHAIKPKLLIDIKSISDLAYIRPQENALKIGALTPLRTLENSTEIRQKCPIILQAVKSIATAQIRNIGTIGGNICQTVKCPYFNQSHINLFMRQSIEPCQQRGGSVCHAARVDSINHSILGKAVQGCLATTASDLSAPLMVLSASMKAVGPEGDRIIPVERFFMGGGRTGLKENEILSEIEIPLPVGLSKSKYQKYAHSGRNFSILNAAVLLWLNSDKNSCKDIRIVIGGLSPIPFRLLAVEGAIKDTAKPSLKFSDAFKEDTKGARIKGDQSRYKLKRAEIMIRDIIHSLFQTD